MKGSTNKIIDRKNISAINIARIKFKNVFIVLLFPCVLIAQTQLTQEQIQQDFSIMKNVLIHAHPGLYEYTTKPQWDSIFNRFENEKSELRNSDDLFRSFNEIVSNIKDGHMRVLHPKMDPVPPLFPLLIKIIDGKFYADTDDFSIPAGSEINSIDGLNSQDLLIKMLKYAHSDGNNLTKKYRQIEIEFGILHYYEFGATNQYTVTYTTPNHQTKTQDIKNQPFVSIGARFPNRNSYFSNDHKHTNKFDHFKNTLGQKWPYLNFIDGQDIAVLTVNTFALDPKEFKSKLIAIFKQIKKKKSKSLIIDVRQNDGGYRANAIHLFSFLTDQPFKQRTSESTVVSELIEQKFIKHTMSDYGQFFKNYFQKSTNENNRWVLNVDAAEEMMKPYKKPFKGQVYVLIGGKTFSAGSAFALNAKNNAKITLVGEETGGGYYFHTGQFPVIYELPHSKIMLGLSLVKINHFVNDTTVTQGTGILPDIKVNLSRQDLIKGTDSQLNSVIELIKQL